MRVLIVGGGGREHALAWKSAQSNLVDHVYCAPGNAGTASEPKVSNLSIAAADIEGLADFAKREAVGLTIVGPEAPLVDGIVDVFSARGLKCFGPAQDAAMLEGSKAFMKDFLKRHRIPTASYANFTELDDALAYIETQPAPLVVKADGLAAGKGVVVAATRIEAAAAARGMLSGERFGAAGKRIVIEEFLAGEEASFIVMTDGEHIIPFASSQDHKARDDGDRGPNTGGMGAYSPAPIVDAAMCERVIADVIRPTLTGMRADGRRYSGFLYAGLMIMPDGVPKVLEFNCRCGDPETQPIMMRLRSDLALACLDVIEGRGERVRLDWDPRTAVGVVMASGGYPGSHATGHAISGLDGADPEGVKVFHAGTTREDGAIVNTGGRVLCVVGLGDTVASAQRAAYARVETIGWQDAFYRRDIGHRAIARDAG